MTRKSETTVQDRDRTAGGRRAPRPARPLARAPGRDDRAGHRPPVPRQADLSGALRAGGRAISPRSPSCRRSCATGSPNSSASAFPRSPRAISPRTAPANTSSGCATAPPSRRSTSRNGHRRTFCISSQAGCALACSFCVTGYWGAGRNLTAGEIVGQVLAIRADRGLPMEGLNLVFMGMGEPLLNLENVKAALDILTEWISPHRITVSTVGILPGLEEMARWERRPNLAISLHAPDEERRGRDHADQPHLSAGRADAAPSSASRWRRGAGSPSSTS